MTFQKTDGSLFSLIVKGWIIVNCGGAGVENHVDVDRPNQKESMSGHGEYNNYCGQPGTEIKLDNLNGWVRQEITVKTVKFAGWCAKSKTWDKEIFYTTW